MTRFQSYAFYSSHFTDADRLENFKKLEEIRKGENEERKIKPIIHTGTSSLHMVFPILSVVFFDNPDTDHMLRVNSLK
ncbi:hypothetical protein L596_013941 [Steinernema carpocapsae]|uniref:Uncharacterized protein n=1 Tax=Steinernema carpocapsae TaxID=34508 RepID=A0A4U5NBC1_STECR|nr:hypothetical protein L596_013941 [Steinernema carpocapsae]